MDFYTFPRYISTFSSCACCRRAVAEQRATIGASPCRGWSQYCPHEEDLPCTACIFPSWCPQASLRALGTPASSARAQVPPQPRDPYPSTRPCPCPYPLPLYQRISCGPSHQIIRSSHQGPEVGAGTMELSSNPRCAAGGDSSELPLPSIGDRGDPTEHQRPARALVC